MDRLGVGERTLWGNNFPTVIRNGDLGSLKKEPEYKAAKAGDEKAALALVNRVLSDDTVQRIHEQLNGRKPRILPVLAVESSGRNKIPLMMARVLADRLDLEVECGIVQREKVGRTGQGADHRLAFNPTFDGMVVTGGQYLIVDDTLTMGGTIASLRGYVENRGGEVLAAAVMTGRKNSLDLAVKPGMLERIERKHGSLMNEYWQETFGYGIENLTQAEAGHLRAATSVDSIRDRISKARDEGSRRLGKGGAEKNEEAGLTTATGMPLSGDPSKALLSSAEGADQKQRAIIEGAPVERTYQDLLAVYILEKQEQAERVEDRLELLLDRQMASYKQNRNNAPGLLASPSKRSAWQASLARQQGRLHTINQRLSAVRDIQDGMGLHGPIIEELGTRKLRARHPGLAADWDSMRKAVRHNHETEIRAKKQSQAKQAGRTHSIKSKR